MRAMGTSGDGAVRRDQTSDLQLIIDSTPGLIHTGRPDGYLDFFNQTWLSYVGRRLEDLQGWKWTAFIHPEDVEGIVEKWRASLASGEPFLHEARVLRADGEYRWMLHHKVAVRDGCGQIAKWYGSSIDIEDRRRAEGKIREQEAELRQILDLTPQHLAVLAPLGEPLYANRAALEYFGIDIDQWRAEKARSHFVHPDDREMFLREREEGLIEGTPHEFEARLRRHDGTFRWFLLRRNPLRDEWGHVTRWYSSAIDIDDLKQAEERLRQENTALREEIDETSMFEEIVGTSSVLRAVLSRIAKVAPSDSTVLITGETGTGKELIARAVHKRSRRAERAFVSVNCAAFAPSLISSELFGHEKGAFTGAAQRRIGRFELADSGTIFLDEVGELLADTQAALLRVLQEREFERVGGGQPVRVNVRVIAATNRDLNAAVANGTFRQDLFYRLNVFPIEVPPLRERKEDLLMLVEYFVQRYANRAGKNIRSIDKKTLDLLQAYDWPGNIRELQNVIERSVILSSGDVVAVDKLWLSKEISRPVSRDATSVAFKGEGKPHSEREIIETALAESKGRVSGPSGAAFKLGMSPSTLEDRIKALKIDKRRFKYG
jgi:formate hydrogenlyase transcriptional activator